MKSRFFILIAIGIIVWVAFGLRIHNLEQWPQGLSADEAINAIDAVHITQTARFPIYEDPFRPEILFRLVQGTGSIFFGSSIWAFRFTSAIIGTLTIAAIYWATQESLSDLSPSHRRIAGLIAAGSLAIALGHLTLTRTLYRAVPQPLFMALLVGFLLRGFRTKNRRDYMWAGLFLAGVTHTYLAGLLVPFALIPYGLSLLIGKWSTRQTWIPNLVVMTVVLAILTSPLIYLFFTDSDTLLNRANQVRNERSVTLTTRIEQVRDMFFDKGDINSQYNVESAPVIPENLQWLFLLGLAALVIRIRQPSSALILGLMIISPIPVLLANEVPHGLRIIGAFGAFPLVIGVGVGLILTLLSRLPTEQTQRVVYGAGLGLFALVLWNAHQADKTYNNYWQKPLTWSIYDKELPRAEWFFRTDNRDMGLWIAEQNRPMLIPIDEISRSTTRAWLLDSYPHVNTSEDLSIIPSDTLIVVPWALETDDLMRDSRQYVLLENDTITIFPPFTHETRDNLLSNIDSAETSHRENGDLMAHIMPLSNAVTLQIEPRTVSNENTSLPLYDGQVQLLGWRGVDTLASVDEEQIIDITVDFRTTGSIWHHYSALVSFHTQDFDRKAWHNDPVWRWLYPSTLWQSDDVVSQTYTLPIPLTLKLVHIV